LQIFKTDRIRELFHTLTRITLHKKCTLTLLRLGLYNLYAYCLVFITEGNSAKFGLTSPITILKK